MPRTSLFSKRVLITGAGSGIGYQQALGFAREGANIIATDIAEAGLTQLKPEVEALGVECQTQLLDITDAAAFTAFAEQLLAENKVPDILVNNAGIGLAKPIIEMDGDDWDRLHNINLKGMHNGCKAFAHLWLNNGLAGHLVNVTSSVAFCPIANMGGYSASKAAAYAMTETLAQELADTNIAVTNVCPGAINTNITKGDEGFRVNDTTKANIKKYYQERGTNPVDMAAAIVRGVSKKQTLVLFGDGAKGGDMARRLLTHRTFRNMCISISRKLGFLSAKSS